MSTEEQTTRRFYGAVLRVSDLPACRRFYSDVVGLGEPAVDSNFWIEFQLAGGGMVLGLELDPTADGDTPGNVYWSFEVADLEEFSHRLEQLDIWPFRSVRLPPGRRGLVYLDPEKNPFLVLGRA